MRDGWQLSNSGYTQLGKVNTLRARWIAEFGGGLSNEFLTGYQTVRDSRELPEQVPLILTAVGNIGAATSWLAAGAERFSQGNSLDQNIFSVADNLSFGTGAHRFTAGTQNEFFSFENVFFQASIGVWSFSSLDSLAAGTPSAFQRRIPTPLQPKGPIALIGAQQFGLYIQDQWSPSERISFTIGLRADIPLINSPRTNPVLLNDPNLPINTGDFPNANILWSPRLGLQLGRDGAGAHHRAWRRRRLLRPPAVRVAVELVHQHRRRLHPGDLHRRRRARLHGGPGGAAVRLPQRHARRRWPARSTTSTRTSGIRRTSGPRSASTSGCPAASS